MNSREDSIRFSYRKIRKKRIKNILQGKKGSVFTSTVFEQFCLIKEAFN